MGSSIGAMITFFIIPTGMAITAFFITWNLDPICRVFSYSIATDGEFFYLHRVFGKIPLGYLQDSGRRTGDMKFSSFEKAEKFLVDMKIPKRRKPKRDIKTI